jgi:hypothetical protein
MNDVGLEHPLALGLRQEQFQSERLTHKRPSPKPFNPTPTVRRTLSGTLQGSCDIILKRLILVVLSFFLDVGDQSFQL